MAWKCGNFLVDFYKDDSSLSQLMVSQILHLRTYGLGLFHYMYANLSAIGNL